MAHEESAPGGGEPAGRYRVVAAGFVDRVEGIAAGGWGRPSPCEGWTVRDVVAHVVIVHRRVLARLNGGELPDIEPPAPQAGEDLPTDVRTMVAMVQASVDHPWQASREVESIIGPLRFADLVGTLLCSDILLHTWDLARATGQDERLDRDAVAQARGFLVPRDVELRVPGEFGPKLDPPPGSDEQTRLIAFSGRRP